MSDDVKKGNEGGGKVLRFERESSFYAKRGDAKRAQNDPVSAIVMYNKALERDPHDYDTRLAAAEVLTDMSRFNDSNKLLVPYMHEDEEFMKEAYCIVGFNLLGMNETEGARGCFNRFFDMTDEVSARTDAMLDALDYIDSLDEEPELLEDAAVMEFESKLFSAQKALDSGNFAEAVKAYSELHEKKPDDERLLYKLSLSYLCDKKAEESGRCADMIIERSPRNWAALSVKLMSARILGNELEMKRAAKLLEACDSEDPEELFRVNSALLEAGFTRQAEGSAKRLVKLLPYDCLSNHRLALCYMRTGQYKRAAELYEKLLRIDKSDCIAKYYRTGCLEAEQDGGSDFCRQKSMLQYQMPFDVILESIKKVTENREATPEDLRERWTNDSDFRDTVRWAFSLREFSISFAMLTMMRIVRDENAELLVREVLADIDVPESIMNEALGVLKSMGAEEPFFAMAEGRLLEGRVNIVDLSSVNIPKSYSNIYPRMHEKAKELYSAEVLSVAGGIVERIILACAGKFPPLSKQQSEAMSAAVEFLACEHCSVPVKDDIIERYEITGKRLENALDKIMRIIENVRSPLPDDGEGDNE